METPHKRVNGCDKMARNAEKSDKMTIRCDLRLGDWRKVLEGEICDALICDPPYSARTHEGQPDRYEGRSDLDYAAMTPDGVRELVAAWAARTRGWMLCLCDDVLIQVYRDAYAATGRMDFAPVPILSHRVRLTGDGPGSCAVYAMVSRPREARMMSWGSLPGWYEAPREVVAGMIGCKPQGLMRALVRDYSKPGDTICDPYAGSGATLTAARVEDRPSVGSEVDPAHYEIARKRLAAGWTPRML